MQKIKMKAKLVLIVITILSVLTACSTTHSVDSTNLNQLQNMSADNYKPKLLSAEIGQLRVKALEDTAMSLGARGGLARASELINVSLEKDKKYLETIYNFNGMMLSHGVLPPVLVEGDNSLNLDDPDTIRVADKTYKIVKQARFATTPPNWREYLKQSYARPELPNKVMLPKNAEEQKIWRRAIRLGWERGTQQAYTIFQQNLARLKRDYSGMILYRKLLQEKMITAPYVAKTNLGVTGDGNDMRINDQVLRIVEHPQLQTDSQGWKAIVVKE